MSKNILKYNNHRVFFVISIYESIKKYQVYCNGKSSAQLDYINEFIKHN
jgi:hypothetical protein